MMQRLLLVCLVLAVGCGDGGESDTGSTSVPGGSAGGAAGASPGGASAAGAGGAAAGGAAMGGAAGGVASGGAAAGEGGQGGGVGGQAGQGGGAGAGIAGQGGSSGLAGKGGAAGAAGQGGAVDCEALSDAIAKKTSIVGSCTAAIRFSYETLAPIAFTIACGEYPAISQAEARAMAAEVSGVSDAAVSLSGEQPEDVFVFHEQAGDFGGFAVVNRPGGAVVLAGTIVWDGAGQYVYPGSFSGVDELGVGCMLAGKEPLPAPGFDLRTGEALPPEEATKVMTAAWATAVPLGMAKAGYLFNATVLLYAPAIGGFDPTTAEYVALITGGWLE